MEKLLLQKENNEMDVLSVELTATWKIKCWRLLSKLENTYKKENITYYKEIKTMMEFKMIMKDFKEMTTRIIKAVPKKASIAILQKVLVMTENNYVYFIATDTEQELRVYKNVTVVENGKFCIDLDVLKKVSKLKANLITIKYDTEEQKMIVNTGKKTVTFYDKF